MAGRPTDSAASRLPLAGAVLATLLIGLAMLPFPFMGDQALFAVFGRLLDAGDTLYTDFWDVKQPGIFVFYWMAGRLFGFTEVGIHLLELMYLTGFSLIVWRVLRDRYRNRWVASLMPVVLVGWYLAVGPIAYRAQVEVLVGPLVFGSAWLVWKGESKRFFGAGVLGGLALFFKLALLPLLAAVWLVALHESGGIRRQARRSAGPLAAGLATVILPFIGYVLLNDLGGLVWWTYIEYPPQVLPLAGRTLGRLLRGAGEFGLLFLPFFLLAARGLWIGRKDGLARIWAAWLVAGIGTYLVQLWWGYLLLVILVPLALLALDGLDDLLGWGLGRRRLALSGLVLAMLPALAAFGSNAVDLGQNRFGLGTGRSQYQSAVSDDYRLIPADSDHLSDGDGPIAVIGNPLYLYLSGRDPSPVVNGWSPEFWTDRLWGEVGEGLRAERPRYLLLEEFGARKAGERSPETLQLIAAEYEVLRPSTRDGVWYILRSAP